MSLFSVCEENSQAVNAYSKTYVMTSCIRRRLTADTCWETCYVFEHYMYKAFY